MQALSLKMVLLGKIYAGTPRYFPLGKLFSLRSKQTHCMNGSQLSF